MSQVESLIFGLWVASFLRLGMSNPFSEWPTLVSTLLAFSLALLSSMVFGIRGSKKKWEPKGKVGFRLCHGHTRRLLTFSCQHVYITGGSQGLGLALAKILVKRGANISIVARTQSKLDDALKELEVGKTHDLPSLLDLYVLRRHFVYRPRSLSKHFPSPLPLPQHLLRLWRRQQQGTTNSQTPSFVVQALPSPCFLSTWARQSSRAE